MRRAGSSAGFLIGDIIATVASAAAILIGACWLTPQSLPPFGAMLCGMAAGMALSIPCFLIAATRLGMIEPMIKIMLAGMVAGMLGGMLSSAQTGPGLIRQAAMGAACGLGCALAVAGADWALRRRRAV